MASALSIWTKAISADGLQYGALSCEAAQ